MKSVDVDFDATGSMRLLWKKQGLSVRRDFSLGKADQSYALQTRAASH